MCKKVKGALVGLHSRKLTSERIIRQVEREVVIDLKNVILNFLTSNNKIGNSVLQDRVHGLYQGICYFCNDFHKTHTCSTA
jgi:hypothetical protein